jgi:transcriptional regulator with XRE-family HTH domain
MTLFLVNPSEMAEHLAKSAQRKRLALNLSQKTLSQRSGVSLAVIKQFERTGKISLVSLLKIALVLDCLKEFEGLFPKHPPEKFLSLDDFLKDDQRKRGRR